MDKIYNGYDMNSLVQQVLVPYMYYRMVTDREYVDDRHDIDKSYDSILIRKHYADHALWLFNIESTILTVLTKHELDEYIEAVQAECYD